MFAFFPANSQTWLNSFLISILIAHPCEEFRKAQFWKFHFWFKNFQCGTEQRHTDVQKYPRLSGSSEGRLLPCQQLLVVSNWVTWRFLPLSVSFLNWHVLIVCGYRVQCDVSLHCARIKSGQVTNLLLQTLLISLWSKHSKSSFNYF